MFSQNGLSLDQAPPISVILRFFFSGSLFGILAGILTLLFSTEIFDASSTEALIFTHTLTLGVMLSFMFAALFQMLPVIAGVKLSSPVKKANTLQYPFILGTLSLLFAFWLSMPILFILSSFLLAGSIFYIVIIMLSNLTRLQSYSNSSRGMMVALLSLAMVVLLALYMTGTLGGMHGGASYGNIKEVHYSFGLFGWIALLIISISFQVIEMFYVTPPYPKLIGKYLPIKIFVLLIAGLLLSFFYGEAWHYIHLLIALILIGYAALTLRRLSQKKRPLSDATVWFWRTGLSALILSMVSLLVAPYVHLSFLTPLSYILFAAFALSIVFAMFYKIVPFLTWFHLNAQGYFTAPMMHEVIHPKAAMKHLYIHLATLITFILSIFFSPLIYLAGILMILSFGTMAYHIVHAHTLYKQTQETGEKFNMAG